MKLAKKLAAMLELHDKVEEALLIARRGGIRDKPLWLYHDWLEREIMNAEAKLPPEAVEELIADV